MSIGSSYDLPISGYASLFGVQDVSGDVVRKGAFSASLLKLGGAPLPMLFGHETIMPIGVWDRIVEDAAGLFVQGRLLRAPKGRRHIRKLVEAGALSGLSIGYRAQRHSKRVAGGRELIELDLWEVSIVAFPMLRGARLKLRGARPELPDRQPDTQRSPELPLSQLPKRTAL